MSSDRFENAKDEPQQQLPPQPFAGFCLFAIAPAPVSSMAWFYQQLYQQAQQASQQPAQRELFAVMN